MQGEYTGDPDVALMLRVRAGDNQAFEQLVIKHQKAVIQAAYRYTGNPSAAEDLAQDAFLRMYRAAAAYEPSARFTTWLFTIVRNVCSNYRAREGRHDRDMEPHDAHVLASHLKNPEQLAEAGQVRRSIRRALAELPEMFRLPLILSHYQQMPYEEIATVMELSLAAVKVRIHRAKLLLADRLTAAGSVTRDPSSGFKG